MVTQSSPLSPPWTQHSCQHRHLQQLMSSSTSPVCRSMSALCQQQQRREEQEWVGQTPTTPTAKEAASPPALVMMGAGGHWSRYAWHQDGEHCVGQIRVARLSGEGLRRANWNVAAAMGMAVMMEAPAAVLVLVYQCLCIPTPSLTPSSHCSGPCSFGHLNTQKTTPQPQQQPGTGCVPALTPPCSCTSALVTPTLRGDWPARSTACTDQSESCVGRG